MNDNMDLFGDIPSPAAPKVKVDPDACPISYIRNDDELFSRPGRTLEDDEWQAVNKLMGAGMASVWAAHFVLFENVRTIEQFCDFQPNEEWGSNSIFRLSKRKKIVTERSWN